MDRMNDEPSMERLYFKRSMTLTMFGARVRMQRDNAINHRRKTRGDTSQILVLHGYRALAERIFDYRPQRPKRLFRQKLYALLLQNNLKERLKQAASGGHGSQRISLDFFENPVEFKFEGRQIAFPQGIMERRNRRCNAGRQDDSAVMISKPATRENHLNPRLPRTDPVMAVDQCPVAGFHELRDNSTQNLQRIHRLVVVRSSEPGQTLLDTIP
jgi:hypothetical protein